MTIDESKTVLTTHREHWERLLSEGICDASDGRETIDALTMAIASFEAWEKIKAEIDAYLVAEEFGTAYRQDIRAIIDKHLQEVEE